jgi:hypothetical protein
MRERGGGRGVCRRTRAHTHTHTHPHTRSRAHTHTSLLTAYPRVADGSLRSTSRLKLLQIRRTRPARCPCMARAVAASQRCQIHAKCNMSMSNAARACCLIVALHSRLAPAERMCAGAQGPRALSGARTKTFCTRQYATALTVCAYIGSTQHQIHPYHFVEHRQTHAHTYTHKCTLCRRGNQTMARRRIPYHDYTSTTTLPRLYPLTPAAAFEYTWPLLWLSGSPLQGREVCIAGRALKGGGAMKDGAARSLGENEERNRLPWQGEAVPCVRRASEAVVEKLSKSSISRCRENSEH